MNFKPFPCNTHMSLTIFARYPKNCNNPSSIMLFNVSVSNHSVCTDIKRSKYILVSIKLCLHFNNPINKE